MDSTAISQIEVSGLHQQFHVSVELTPGLNVLYGKNGRGKTTLLHILANYREMDFQRFRYLQFRSIAITTFKGDTILIEREVWPGDEVGVKLHLNGIRLGGDGPIPNLQQTDRTALQANIGGRPVYLPAFRAILERVRSESYAPTAPTREGEFERIRDEERRLQRELQEADLTRQGSLVWSSRSDIGTATARKTLQCREWFGNFVPVVRYPSIHDVVERLSTEFRDAQVETGMQERQMLSEMFVQVFKALLSNDRTPSETEVETLTERVQKALAAAGSDPDQELYTDKIGSRLQDVMTSDQLFGAQPSGEPERRVLKLYADMLERRNAQRQRAFSGVRQFEAAINKFLDEKTLHISDERPQRRSLGSAGVYVRGAGGRTYALSSLSSGERQVLTMLFSATRMTGATGTFLIDEPELSLHIDWQRMILSELMAQAGGRQIVACTHSPEVGADHTDSLQLFEPNPEILQLPSRPTDSPDSLIEDAL